MTLAGNHKAGAAVYYSGFSCEHITQKTCRSIGSLRCVSAEDHADNDGNTTTFICMNSRRTHSKGINSGRRGQREGVGQRTPGKAL
ncbi:hypothetical protein GDO78_009306 [Eleutherodactylus coqui]|uniref:Uncharacterized protein n=1 Tax=Eleutherodactylus coqui TaxID=57060 RepID=A0A8J6K8S1_ELECQ|nr:hypothetical protein GDO78_009306 [Eleutherodactylus coqui]